MNLDSLRIRKQAPLPIKSKGTRNDRDLEYDSIQGDTNEFNNYVDDELRD